jgi:hypothetical protein
MTAQMSAQEPLRKTTPRETPREHRRPAFHLPANDNNPIISRRIVGWVLMALGFLAAMAAVLAGA